MSLKHLVKIQRMQNIITYIKRPKTLGLAILSHFGTCLPDSLYLKIMFRLEMGYKLNLEKPHTFNEKLQWLKLYNRDPKYTQMVDKFEAKTVAENILGNDYIIPTLGVWNRFEDIDFSSLPDRFVLKTTNGGGGGGVIICRDKNNLNLASVAEQLNSSLKENIYHQFKEWPYKNVIPRILAEKFMVDESGELRDYKFYCFNGEPKVFLVASERFSGHRTYFDYFDMEGNHLPFTQGGMNNPITPMLPSTFEEMKQVAMKLSHGLPHVRIDLYSVDEKVYFGEFTFFDSSGFEKFTPWEWDDIFGNWLKLPTSSKERG